MLPIQTLWTAFFDGPNWKSLRTRAGLPVLLCMFSVFGHTQAAQYSFMHLGISGTLNGVHQPVGISASGEVVGYNEQANTGFIWTSGGGLTWLNILRAPSQATGISGNGTYIATGSWNGSLVYIGGNVDGFYVTGYTYPQNLSYAVNDYGDAVGQTQVAVVNGQPQYEAFYYSQNDYGQTFKYLGTLGGATSVAYGINDTNLIVGSSANSAGYVRAFYSFRTGPPTDFDPGDTIYDSAAYAVNKNGLVAGVINRGRCPGRVISFRCRGPYYYPVTFSGSTITSLGSLGGAAGAALALDSYGNVVGWSQTTSGQHHAFLYVNGHMIDMNSLSMIGATGWTLTDAAAINDAGMIVGHAVDSTGHDEVFVLLPIGV